MAPTSSYQQKGQRTAGRGCSFEMSLLEVHPPVFAYLRAVLLVLPKYPHRHAQTQPTQGTNKPTSGARTSAELAGLTRIHLSSEGADGDFQGPFLFPASGGILWRPTDLVLDTSLP